MTIIFLSVFLRWDQKKKYKMSRGKNTIKNTKFNNKIGFSQ